jgi:hypothetical protein
VDLLLLWLQAPMTNDQLAVPTKRNRVDKVIFWIMSDWLLAGLYPYLDACLRRARMPIKLSAPPTSSMLVGSGVASMAPETVHLLPSLVPPSSLQVPATRQPLAIRSRGFTAPVLV